MKTKLFLTGVVLGIITTCAAQKKAVTESGEEVILNDNGTWEYVQKKDSASTAKTYEIKTNPDKIIKPANATFLLKSTKCKIGFWLDPQKWEFEKSKSNESAEYELQLKEQDLYGMVITEKIEIPLETLRDIAFENAREVAPDMKVQREEYRNVNGLRVLYMEMSGNLKGIKFTYFGHYYSFEGGTIQFITYTSQNLVGNYKKDIEEILSGIVSTD